MSKHTPGPWKWGTDWQTLEVGPGEFSGDKYADLQLCGPKNKEIIPIGIDHYEPIWDVNLAVEEMPSKADRNLIAAAPELLEACKQVKDEFQNEDIKVPDIIEKAIAKAEGGSDE